MTETKTEFKPGDVVRYDPTNRWCCEGTAIATTWKDRVVLLDTYWRSIGDDHRLTVEEIETVEFLFNTDDYDEMSGGHRGRNAPDTWATYAPTDRQRVTSQHGLQSRWFLRKGAQPDLATQIDNARQAVADAYEKLRWAGRDVDLALAELARLEADQ